MSKWISFGLFILLIIVGIFYLTSQKQGIVELRIGTVLPLSGDLSGLGLSAKEGIELATEEWNSKGGIQGQRIVLVHKDDMNNSKETVKQIGNLIDENKVAAIIGSISSETSIVGGKYANTRKVPLINPTSGDPRVTVEDGIRKEFVFRVCLTDEIQAKALTEVALQKLNLKTSAIIFDRRNPGLAEHFKSTFEKKGRTLFYKAYSSYDTDFSALLNDIKDINPDVLFIADFYTRVNIIAAQAREIGINSVMLGGVGWDSHFLNFIAINNGYYTAQFYKDDPRREVQEFISKYKEKFNNTPDTTAALAYDAANLLYTAIGSLQKIDRTEIQIALNRIRNFNGVTGTMAMDSEGNPKKDVFILRIKDWKIDHFYTIK